MVSSIVNDSSPVSIQNIPIAFLQRVEILQNECPRYDVKQFDGEALVMLELWRIWSTSSLLSLPGPL